MYREVQLDFAPEMEVFHMLFERCHTKSIEGSLKQHTKYFNFRSIIQLDHPVNDRNPSLIQGLNAKVKETIRERDEAVQKLRSEVAGTRVECDQGRIV